MYPAKRVIDAFGGPQQLAAAIDRNVSRIYRWTYSEDRGGTGGAIPGGSKTMSKILEAAKERGISLTPSDLVDPTPPRKPDQSEAA